MQLATPGLPLLFLTLVLTACGAPTAPRANSPTAHSQQPTLAHFWEGSAHFVLDIANTALPLGESDTQLLPDGSLRPYVHASAQSLGVRDHCGNPVDFPGCVVPFTSHDRGQSFLADASPTCRRRPA